MSTITVGVAKEHVKAIEELLQDNEKLTNHVKGAFAHFDTNKNGKIDFTEAKAAVADLCKIMNLPVPSEGEFDQHLAALDQDGDKSLSEQELGSGFVGAFTFKVATLKHYLGLAGDLPDDAPLPSQ